MTDEIRNAMEIVEAALMPGAPLTPGASCAAWTLAKAYLAEHESEDKPKNTVRVRAAVAVDEKGNYQINGWSGSADDDMRDQAVDIFEPVGNEAVHFIEVDVPLPESKTIEGGVVG